MSEKKRQKIYDLLNAESFFVYRIQSKEKKSYGNELLKEKEYWRIEQKFKRRLLNCSHYGNEEKSHNVSKKAR